MDMLVLSWCHVIDVQLKASERPGQCGSPWIQGTTSALLHLLVTCMRLHHAVEQLEARCSQVRVVAVVQRHCVDSLCS
jgi:hypothetical protein